MRHRQTTLVGVLLAVAMFVATAGPVAAAGPTVAADAGPDSTDEIGAVTDHCVLYLTSGGTGLLGIVQTIEYLKEGGYHCSASGPTFPV